MLRILLVSFLTILLSCSAGNNMRDKNIEIVIEYPISYKYDLKNQTYTVFYETKSPSKINFHLSDKEINAIIDKYYTLDIDKMIGKTFINDECTTMPKSYIILRVKSKSGLQEIKIDENCNDFYFSNFIKAGRIKKFLDFIRDILSTKPEIKNAPKSDIMYI